MHPEWEVVLDVHGDDFLAVGSAQDLKKIDKLMGENYEVKSCRRLDPHTSEVRWIMECTFTG